jgi:hypothetical protein
VSEQEKGILSLIMQGYYDPSIKTNTHQSLLGYMRVDQTDEMDYLLYTKYFQPLIQQCGTIEKGSTNPDILSAIATWSTTVQTRKVKSPHKADIIRIQKADDTISSQRHSIFEFLLLDYATWSLGKKVTGTMNTIPPQKALYTLLFLRKVSVLKLNKFVLEFIDHLIENTDISSPETVNQVFLRSADYIEKNGALMEYADQTLYSHQRDLFSIFSDQAKREYPKLVLYIAPTGTGKTLSPLGLSQDYRVIFVCGARHVGLALAKSAISSGKRVAFAFGCTTASDIRLHYFAAADYTVNKHSGGIYKVDNSNGIRVEIMICDIASYLIAMYYMQSFHNERDILTYWDEPTITMDYEDHPLHSVIHRAWSKNQISKVILSCATLPTASEIGGVIHDFRSKFYGHGQDEDADEDPKEAEIHIIHSHDCKKTISLMNKDGKLALPHLLFPNYGDLIACVEHCEQNKSLLRYMDISEIVRFCTTMQPQLPHEMRIEAKFNQIDKITLNSIKNYYLSVLKELPAENWHNIYQTCIDITQSAISSNGLRKIQSEIHPPSVFLPAAAAAGQPITRQTSMATTPLSTSANSGAAGAGVLLTTADAHTLTDGPTIYLAEDVDKIGRFYIQQSKIPESIFATIQQKIDRNNMIQQSIEKLEREQEAKMKLNSTSSSSEKDYSRKAGKEPVSREMQQLLERINTLRESIQTVHLSPMYIPNTKQHQDIWVPPRKGYVKNAFTPNVDERDVREIMGLDVSNQLKLLLILGIGVFSMHENIAYMEIMKRLANEQRLFLIIASSDYIYGTNYQFCHGFIGKDLTNMTQQKTIQAIGRIGRNNIQQEYTVRFRDDTVLHRLFTRMEHNREAEIMNRLFSTDEEDA